MWTSELPANVSSLREQEELWQTKTALKLWMRILNSLTKKKSIILSLLFTKCILKSHLKIHRSSGLHVTLQSADVFHQMLKAKHQAGERQLVEFLKCCSWDQSYLHLDGCRCHRNICGYEMDWQSQVITTEEDIAPEKLDNFEDWNNRNDKKFKGQNQAFRN